MKDVRAIVQRRILYVMERDLMLSSSSMYLPILKKHVCVIFVSLRSIFLPPSSKLLAAFSNVFEFDVLDYEGKG